MDNRDEEKLAELQDPANWDYEHAEPFPGTELPHAVVAVRLSGEDFVRVAKQAERAGLKVTEFIRDAALDRAAQESLGEPASSSVRTRSF